MKIRASMITTAVAVTVLVGSTTGCVTTPVSMARYDDRSDPCYSYRQPLIQTEQQLGQKMVAGALGGALIAGGVAAATGAKSRDVAIAAVAGALLGGSIGYYEGMRQKEMTQQAMLATIYQDASADAGRFTRTRGLIGDLNACRNRQVDGIERDFRDGRIDRPTAVGRLDVVKSSVDLDNQLIAQVLGHTGERTNTYVDAAQRATGASEKVLLGQAQDFRPVVATGAPRAAETQMDGSRYVATRSSNVRAAPSTQAEVVGGLQEGQSVPVLARQGEWYRVSFNNQDAFVHASLLAEAGSAAARASVARAAQGPQPTTPVPRAENPVQEVVIEKKLAEATAESTQQQISSRLSDARLLLGA